MIAFGMGSFNEIKKVIHMSHELLLHIGANKTGSSAVQHFIRKNVVALNAAGYAIPDRNLGWSNKITGEHVFTLQSLFNDNENTGALDAKIDELMSARPAGSTVLLSGENISNHQNSNYFRNICNKYKTKIVIYIRRQDDLLLSSWQQWNAKIETDLNAWLVRSMPIIGHWERTIDDWEAIAGLGSVDVRIFERESFPGGNIASDFAVALGLPPKAPEFDYATPDVNPSFNDFIVPLVGGNRDVFKDVHDNDFYRFIESMTGEIYSKGKKISLVSRAHREGILAYYMQENARVCKKFFPDRKNLFKPIDHSKYEYLSQGEIRGHQLRFLTHLVYKLGKRVLATESRLRELTK